MKLASVALPLVGALALGGPVPSAPVPVLPKAPVPPPASTILVLPVPARPSAPMPPAPVRTFVVPSPRGGFSMINIPRCYLVFGMQSRGGRTEFTDRAARVLALPSQCRTLLSAPTPPAPR